MKKLVLAILCLMMFHFFGCHNQKKDNNVVKIGAILPMTGNLAGLGNTLEAGLSLAINEINEKSSNLKFEIYIEDTNSEQKNVLSSYYKLKNKGIRYFVSTTSSACKALKPQIIRDNNLIFCICSLPELTENSDWNIFKIGNSTIEESSAISSFLKDNTIGNISLFYPNSEYGLSFKESICSDFKNVRRNVAYNENDLDFKSVVAGNIIDSTQCVVAIGYSSSLGKVINSIKTITPNICIVCNLGFTNSDVYNLVGKNAINIKYIDYLITPSNRTTVREKYVKDNYNTSFTSTCYLSYMIPYCLYDVCCNVTFEDLETVSKTIRSKTSLSVDTLYNFSVYPNGDITPVLTIKTNN